jgi:glutamine synthetase type III
LLDPGLELLKHPETSFESFQHFRFVAFLAAFLKGMDDWAGVIRCSIASHSQDLRLGANEAPPAIMSVFLGEALTQVVDSVIDLEHQPLEDFKSPKAIKVGIKSLIFSGEKPFFNWRVNFLEFGFS